MEGSLATTKGLLTHQALDSKEIALSLDSFEDTVKDTLRQLVRVSRTIEDLLKKVSKEAERPAAYPAHSKFDC